jgi:transposase
VEVKDLKREGLSIKAISAATGFDRKTVREYLAKPDEIRRVGLAAGRLEPRPRVVPRCGPTC